MIHSSIFLTFGAAFILIVTATAAVTTCGYNFQVVLTHRKVPKNPFATVFSIKIFHDQYPSGFAAIITLFSAYLCMHLHQAAFPVDSTANSLCVAIIANASALFLGWLIGRAIRAHREDKIKAAVRYILDPGYRSTWYVLEDYAQAAGIIVFETDSLEHKKYLQTPQRKRKYHYPVFAYSTPHTGG